MESQKNEVKIIYTYLFKSNCKKPHLQKKPQILLNDRTICYQSLITPPPKKKKTNKPKTEQHKKQDINFSLVDYISALEK